MKIIWLTAEMPYPPNTGGRVAMFRKIEYLSKNNDIYLYSIIDSDVDLNHKDGLIPYCVKINLYDRRKEKVRVPLKLFNGPYVCVSRWISKMKEDISNCNAQINPHYVLVDFPQMLGNLSNEILNSGKVVLNQHNTEYLTLRNLSSAYKSLLMRYAAKIESIRLEKLEKKYYNNYNIKLFTFVSTEDKLFFETKYHRTNTYLLPIGTEVFSYVKQNRLNNSFNITYFGKMSYPANEEAVTWFVDNVFIKLKKIVPYAKFYIVGKDPTQNVKELPQRDDDIIVTGTVDDINQYYNISDLVVIPLFHGGGVKVKLLEALGHGKLVITTNKGIEGTIFKDGKELLIANTAEEFLQLCLAAYHKYEQYEDIKQNGLNTIELNFSWSKIVGQYEEKLLSLL